MTTAWTPSDRLRRLLGEAIPDGGDASETFFSDSDIDNLLTDANGDVRGATREGWLQKAAYYADLCNVTEGNALRQASDLQAHALAMVKQFGGPGTIATAGRARVGRIVRRT